MLPVLFSIGNLSISSFGLLLALAFLLGIFLIWRLSRAWDLNEEKVLDLILLTFLGGLVGARIYFVSEHLSFFARNLLGIILIHRYPGFSFWGGFLGGWLTLYFFARRFKVDFWHIADIAAVGFLGGLVLADLGCFLGGCSVGIASKLFLAVPMVGFVGKRLPVQLFEAILLLILLLKLWSQAIHFHQQGKIVSFALIYLGLIKFLMEFLRDSHGGGYIFSVILIILGLTIYYKAINSNLRDKKRTPLTDLYALITFAVRLITDRQSRLLLFSKAQKNWYNQATALKWKLRRNRVKSAR